VIGDTGLPVEAVVGRLREALDAHRTAVLVAPPGSGKTTVVPLRLLDAIEGRIVVLEPRRVATRAAARRMAGLLGVPLGDLVGYVTRTDRRVSAATRVEVVTEGVLTRRLQRDPDLPGVGLVIFDEIHERNLQTDLGLALALDARRVVRPDLGILAMSATIDAHRVAALLGDGTPVIEADAGIHPVDIRWAPPGRARLEDHVARVIRRAVDEEPGDVLVFLPGMAEMRRVHERLETLPADVHLLHGSLPTDVQDAALAPGGLRKVVLATDIAESSLTVEGVRVVVDAGLARVPRLDPRTGMTRLHTVTASRASADQRAGRAGRIEPGVAYRLWSKMEHAGRRPHIEPEITQVDLAGLVMELAAWGTPIEDLAWLDPPPARSIGDARSLLRSLGAIDEEGRPTRTGREMMRLPTHPRLARMIADAGDDAPLACVIAALIDGPDVLRGPRNEVTADLSARVRLVTGDRGRSDRRGLDRVRRDADDLSRRAGASGPVDPEAAGRILALAFPDRLAVRRGSPGRFQLRTGTTAWVPSTDPLAGERFVVAADLDGRRKDARIRLAAGIDEDDVVERFAHEVVTKSSLVWEGRRLVRRRERRLGGLALATHDERPEPGPEVTQAILERVRADGVDRLPWTRAALDLRSRVTHLHRHAGDPWPDLGDAALADDLETWLGPHLAHATGMDDLDRLDLARVVRTRLPYPEAADLDRLAPSHLTVPSGRRIPVDYSDDTPSIAVRVQEMFGTTETPLVAGRPVRLELLSPAGRPVQITSDLGGFWEGSWADVRKEMAGRYPKHEWPADPASAAPSRP
jgi:ATP-dependent helicase HrpB